MLMDKYTSTFLIKEYYIMRKKGVTKVSEYHEKNMNTKTTVSPSYKKPLKNC